MIHWCSVDQILLFEILEIESICSITIAFERLEWNQHLDLSWDISPDLLNDAEIDNSDRLSGCFITGVPVKKCIPLIQKSCSEQNHEERFDR